jgi:hypothetical protein
MKRTDRSAVEEFFRGGGEIMRIESPIRVGEQDLIDYLMQSSLPVKYFPGEKKAYRCNGKRYSLQALIQFANEHRRTRNLPPLMLW